MAEYKHYRAISALISVDMDIKRLQDLRLTAIQEARSEGCTWDEIAQCLKLNGRRAAFQKYAHILKQRNGQ